MNEEIHADSVFSFDYPFVKDSYTERDEEGEHEAKCWRPGVVVVEDYTTGKVDAFADGVGKQIVAVVGVFKPGNFPPRVFFTRKWQDPSGKLFGNGKLRILGISAFRRMVRGYRYEYAIRGAK